MWSKISNVLKSRTNDEAEASVSTSQANVNVMSRVLEDHPNLSVFHNPTESPFPHPSPPSSPSKHGRRGMFKRNKAARDDAESLQAPSPLRLPIGLPKKVRSTLSLKGNNSQHSLSPSNMDATGSQQDSAQCMPSDAFRSSQDSARPSLETARSSYDTLRRPSVDALRPSPEHSRPSQESISRATGTPLMDSRFGSVRSILRDPKTPGTGQNVRFFSRDAYKVISPDQSMNAEFQPIVQPTPQTEASFLERLQRASPPASSTPASMPRSASYSKAGRPTVAEVFSPLAEGQGVDALGTSTSQDMHSAIGSPSGVPNFSLDATNLLDMSQIDLPAILPGLPFNLEDGHVLDSAVELTETEGGTDTEQVGIAAPPAGKAITSTPFKINGKTRGSQPESGKSSPMPDDTAFHSLEKSPIVPPMLHDRSQSFSFGQTIFHSMAANASAPDDAPMRVFTPPPSNVEVRPLSHARSNSSPLLQSKSRSRALSDTAFFQNMMRSSPKPPEADINDESTSALVVYSAGAAEPDPFSADAKTYYTPQTMIPVTPPQGVPKHTRKTSKEENIIISLQTQLSLQTELCGQYETDLHARDELVAMLEAKLAAVEAEDGKRKGVLRAWKKKVAELERACRHLEEEVDSSRQESMERSIMDEASGEALRMLHRQISGLERERSDWQRREDALRAEVATLEGLVKERSEDVMQLKEVLWKRDESERELKEGIRQAREEMEMMGNVSVGGVDEEELKKLVMHREQANEDKQRHRDAASEWEEERAGLASEVEQLKQDKEHLVQEMENVREALASKEKEFTVLQAELEAQWQHSEKASDKFDALQKGREVLEKERDELKAEVEEYEQRINSLEVEWNDNENRKAELETEVQELWNVREALEKERDETEEKLQQEHELVAELEQGLLDRDNRITELEQERRFNQDSISRLEDNIRQRDAELAEYTQRVVQRETEAEQLREQMSGMAREHARVVDEQARGLSDAAEREEETRGRLEAFVAQEAAANVETETLRGRVAALTDEVTKLRRHVHELQQESADKEVKIVQIGKQRAQDKEDLQGLNIALDSKQQELELLKRRLGVRGTAGSTPAQPSKVAHHRRESSVFTTPGVSRPPSAASDSGRDGFTANKDRRGADTPVSTTAKVPALGKSTRVNGSTSALASSSTVKSAVRAIDGAMGPPPLKGRVSLAGTPTPTARVSSLSRAPSIKPSAAPSSALHRRGSSGALEHAKSARPGAAASPTLEVDEKENVSVTSTASRRRSMLPTLA